MVGFPERSASFWAPTFPSLERKYFPPTEGSIPAKVLRFLRFTWVLLLAPLHILLALLSHAIIPRSEWQRRKWKRSQWPTPRCPTWSIAETICVPLASRLIYSVAYGQPNTPSPRAEKAVPFLSRWLFAGIRHQGWQIQAEAVTLPPVTSDTGEAGAKDATVPSPNGCANGSANGTARPPPPTRVLTGEAIGYDKLFDDVLQGEVRGESFGVRPQPCPAFWLWKTLAAHVKDGKVVAVKAEVPEAGLGCGPAKRGERVILYLVGGGFNSGNPLTGPLSWTMTRQSGLRLLGVNFRKSTCDNQAFPASLQDALAGYAYLVRRLNFEPRNIILLGDSAGGNLCIALQLYLSALMHASTAPGATDFGLGRPGKLILHSPWADLTLSSPTYTEHWGYDILHPSICAFARDSYLRHFLVPRPQHLHTKLLPAAQRAEEEAAFRNITPATSEMPPTDEKVSSSKRNANGPCNGDARVTKLAPSLPVLPDTLAARFPATDAGRAAFASDLPHTISQLGAAHPFFSPGLPATQSKYLARAMELFGPLPGTVSEKTKKAEPETRFLIFAGGAELFAGEIRALVRNLTSVTGVRVEYVEGQDRWHNFTFLLDGKESKARVDELTLEVLLGN